MPELLSLLSAGAAIAAFVVASLAFFRLQAIGRGILTRESAGQILRAETDIGRRAGEEQARDLRRELGERLDAGLGTIERRVAASAEKLDADLAVMRGEAAGNREGLRALIERKLDDTLMRHAETGKALREEVGDSVQRLGTRVAEALRDASEQQKERLEANAQALSREGEKQQHALESLRQTVESRLDKIREESAAKLEEMRQTVDEKLQSTLETRLGESFTRVVEHLQLVAAGIGEMRTLATSVGDLKSVLGNVKTRGIFGEVQLAMLIEDFLTPDQYVKDACVKAGTSERVEFAIRFRMDGDGEEMLLPVDAKFPREDYEHLLEASAAGDTALVAHFRKALDTRIKACAKDIRDKYINPPTTTDHAILFLPTEGLYAEVLRQPGICEQLQREFRVILAGPTTFAATLSAFQMNFRSLAIARRSSEVWKVLGAVRTEFGKYNEVVDKLGKQLQTAATSVDSLGRRTRAMNRTLRTVETAPDEIGAQRLLGFNGTAGDDEEEPAVAPLTSDILVPLRSA